MKKVAFTGITALVALLFVVASSALASGGHGGGRGIVKSGKCSGASHWKLKAKADDARIETEFEVDQNRVGKRWHVVLKRSGSIAFNAIRTTAAPSGSLEVRRLLAGGAGTKIAATARSLQTGETCSAALTL